MTAPKKPRAASAAPPARPRVDITAARKALVLQGGGALGAYQAGVYAGVFEKHKALDWVAGVSIGAVNAALIAGNPPERRVDRLREFWDLVSSGPTQRLPAWWGGDRATLNQWSAAAVAMFGVPGFFEPRRTPALLMGGAAPLLSYYDTSPLKSTLERLVDFDRINHCETRFSVGAVNVRTGNSLYFDNTVQRIGPEHIMASGALPPGFAPVHIDGEDYWDGGIVSNTPLQYVLALLVRAAQPGQVLLDQRLNREARVASLVADYGDALEAARAAEGDAARPPEKLPARPGPLALLVEQVARQAPPPAAGELKTLGYFRSTWARLSAERRLTQSLAKVPENAGPLNSHHLVHRSLTLMRDLSPEYLNRFMSYVDTLLWLDQASAGTGTAAPESPRKTARGKTAG